MDYVGELLFFKGFSLEMLTEDQVAKHLTIRPVIIRKVLSSAMDSNDEEKVAGDPKRGDRVQLYLPRTCRVDKYHKITTAISPRESASDKYFVERFSFALELMEEDRIVKECPPKAMIIAKKGTTFQPNDIVEVYMPYFEMAGTVTHVEISDARKKFDVLYDFASSRKAGRTRFFAKALELWKKIPDDFEYPEFFPVNSVAAEASVDADPGASVDEVSGSGGGDATVSESKDQDFEDFQELTETNKVRKDLQKKGVRLAYVCKMLRKHGVSDEEIPLYAWQIFPEGKNAIEYMAELVRDKLPPLNVVATYMGILAKIKDVEQANLRGQLEEYFADRDLVGALEVLGKLDNPNNEMLEVHLYDVLSGRMQQKLDYPGIHELLEAIDGTTNADKLEQEKEKSKPDSALVPILEDKVKKDKAQLKNRQKPFQQWLEAFATLIDGDGEFGQLGDWARTLDLLEKEQRGRREKWLEKVENLNSQRQAIMEAESSSTREKLEQGAKELFASFEAPISLMAAWHKRIFGLLFSICASFFTVLAYSVFGDGELTLTTFIAVQASVFGIFYENITPEQFEKDSLKAALAFHVNSFRTVYNESRNVSGRLVTDRRCKWCISFSTLGLLTPTCDVTSGYHKWRSMALHKMIQDRKTDT